LFVIAIMGVLAAMAIPQFQRFQMRARRTEAYVGLKAINTAQQMYYSEKGFYADTFDELGYAVSGGQRVDERTIDGRNYTFSVNVVADGTNFLATATGDIDPGDAMVDVLVIQNGLTVVE